MLHIHPIPILDNNYVWLIENTESHEAVVVDPGVAQPVIDFLHQKNLTLKHILITHSHNDHIGGITDLLAATMETSISVSGPCCAKIPQINNICAEGDIIELWPHTRVDVLHTPGHLPEHVCYVVLDKLHAKQHIFTGDTLFSSGCGRIFDGTPEELKRSVDRLCSFPDDAYLYGTHEYTLANIEFALSVEANNPALQKKYVDSITLRKENKPTLPTTVAIEKATNPFVRCDQAEIIETLTQKKGEPIRSELMVFTELRRLKNYF